MGVTPSPIPAQLWAKIQSERSRLQAEGFTGRYTLEFDCLDGQERKVRVLAPQVAEVIDGRQQKGA
jgi:hypothetical protein